MKHIAGPWVSPDGDLIIQRCVVCGFALIKERLSERMVLDTEEDKSFPTFEMADLVEVTGTNPIIKNVIGQITSVDQVQSIQGLCFRG